MEEQTAMATKVQFRCPEHGMTITLATDITLFPETRQYTAWCPPGKHGVVKEMDFRIWHTLRMNGVLTEEESAALLLAELEVRL
jgi:hypothetical protein